jgi:hypothetical protein
VLLATLACHQPPPARHVVSETLPGRDGTLTQ